MEGGPPVANPRSVNGRDKRPRGTNLNDPGRMRTSCHRCANVRKETLIARCDEESCKYVYCLSCKKKVISELGEDAFEGGCPRCLGLCCCFDKSYSCDRQYHCYKKCPTTFGKRELPKKRKHMIGEGVPVTELAPPKSLTRPGITGIDVTPPSTASGSVTSTQSISMSMSMSMSRQANDDTFYSPYVPGVVNNVDALTALADTTPTVERVNLASPLAGFAVMEEETCIMATPYNDQLNRVDTLLQAAKDAEDEDEDEAHGGKGGASQMRFWMPELNLSPARSGFRPTPQVSDQDVVTPTSVGDGGLASSSNDAYSQHPFLSPQKDKRGSMHGHSFAGVQGETGRSTTADLSPLELGLTWTSDNDDAKGGTTSIPSSLTIKREEEIKDC